MTPRHSFYFLGRLLMVWAVERLFRGGMQIDLPDEACMRYSTMLRRYAKTPAALAT